MEEQPTEQMDSSSDHGASKEEARAPATIPIEDVIGPPGRPAPSPAVPLPRPAPHAPVQPPSTPSAPFGPVLSRQGAGETVIMGSPAPPPLLAWLAVVEGPGASGGQVFTLQRESLIGRKSGQVILAGDMCISGQHAKIRLEPSEEDAQKQVFVLYDLASANGTFAGKREEYRDRRVYRHELHDGDFILIGETTLVFKQV